MLSKSGAYRIGLKRIQDIVPRIENLKEKTILVTGATGMIGSAIVDVMLFMNEEHGYDIKVLAMGRNISRLTERFYSHSEDERLHFIEHDVNSPLEMDEAVDYIIHAASNAHPSIYASDPVGTLMGNVQGTYNMLETARKKRARMIFVSSGEVYGQLSEEDIPIQESKSGYVNSIDARSCYPSGKRAGETLCMAFNKQYGVDVTVVRPSHVYGPTATREDSRASSQFINNALNKQDIVMKSDGLQQRSYCHVLDCAGALLTVLLNGETAEAYNIANAKSNVTIREFAEKTARYGNVKVVFTNPSDDEKKGYTPITRAVLSPEKLEGLGWKSQYSADLGIENTIQVLKEK